MIQRAVTAIIGVVIGLFATFAVFETVLIQLDNLYLLTQDTCNVGTENNPIRTLKLAHVDLDRTSATNFWTVDDIDWSRPPPYDQHDVLRVQRLAGTDSCTPVDGSILGPVRGRVEYYTPSDEFYNASETGVFFTIVDPGFPLHNATWLPADEVFVAQEELVVLLAVIAAIGMPVGAMTAIVFFGQALVSSGVSGQGASQVLVSITAVVVILIAVQLFQQFSGYLGDAFDAVDGDRFAVFDETLGSLAVTISEFWGVLAFAGLVNIATIVWRNYSGNFNIGGAQGGL